jgi:hypothetical protein
MQNLRAALTGGNQPEASFARTLAQSTYYGAAGAFGKAPMQHQNGPDR